MPFERFFENYPESSLEIEILQLVFDRLGYTDEDDFYEDYEGCMTEKELIEKQEEFYDREHLGDYLHDLAKYYTYPTEDLHCYHWWDITGISEIDKISREQRFAEKSADEWLKTIFLDYSNSLSPDSSQATKWKAVRESINTSDVVLYQLVRSIELACEGQITGHDLFNQFQKGYRSIDVMAAFKKLGEN